MTLDGISDEATVRRYRKEAREFGHRMTRLNPGATSAIASCRNPGCQVMVEVYGPNMHFRWIDLSGDGYANERCQGSQT